MLQLTLNAAELAVVVAGVGDPHLKHVDGVVEVGEPTLAGKVEVTGLALFEEDVPVNRLNGHLDADCTEVLLHALSGCNVAGAVVGEVLNNDGSLGGEHAVLVELVAGSLQQGASLVESGLVVVVDGVRIIVALLDDFGLEGAAVTVGHAVRNEALAGS